jgi:probable H4MPT-linked C1 transfer pathway protein
MTWLGLDIGGANLKAALGAGWARSSPFQLWRDPDRLVEALRQLIEGAPPFNGFAVTMTGELCDCFTSKDEGVRYILSAVDALAGSKEVCVYLVDGRFVSPQQASELSLLAAASNWRALAQFACRWAEGRNAVLIDMGSTTTDIIPIVNGQVAAKGLTDTQRLGNRELCYSGVGRTPVCAVVQSVLWGGVDYPVAAELFATTADAYVVLGDIPEQARASWTADGRPLTRANSMQRLARQFCADSSELKDEHLQQIALAVRVAQLRQIEQGITNVIARMGAEPDLLLLSGAGEFLVRGAVQNRLGSCPVLTLSDKIGPVASACAPAYAVAILADEVGAAR